MCKAPHVSPVADTVLEGELSGDVRVAAGSDGAVPAWALARGASVGRYLILDQIGVGGMGIVYAAYDPKLDRRIAVKALYSASNEVDTAGRARLVREAKAMARLSHPNVVAVYDVLQEGDQVLVAMELVEGTSLRAWLHAKRRDWREVLGAFLQAGRGLAGAHAAGLVHRDFKLDNVFMGRDGRVKVGDFGLARATSRATTAPLAAPDDGPVAVTREGALVGTPVYMAPDQLRGAPADVKSDQFSFCAALHEGLYGIPPFEGGTVFALLDSMQAERLSPPPPKSDVPRWLRAIVARGLRRRPEDRFASMNAVIAALEIDPRRARRGRVGVAIAALAVGLVVAGVARERRGRTLECRALGRKAEHVWGDAQRGAVRAAFLSTGRPYAEDTFQRTASVLDAYAAGWSAQATEACEERVERRADDLAAQRATCRDVRLAELGAYVSVLGRAEGETVDRAVRSARALPSLDACRGRDPLQGETTPSDPAVRDEARALEDRLGAVAALRAAGRAEEELAAATNAMGEAERIAFPPLVARARYLLAGAQEDAGDLPTAEASFHRAALAAEGASLWPLAARAVIREASPPVDPADFARAEDRFESAAVWVDRAGADDALGGALLLARSREQLEKGSYDEARTFATRALALFERAHADESLDAINLLGGAADMQGHYDEARVYYTRARDAFSALLGPEHPKVAAELNNLGLLEGDDGHPEEGIKYLRRALEIREKGNGPSHPFTLATASNLVGVYTGAGRYEEALPLAQRIVAAQEALAPDSPDMGFALGGLAISYVGLHRPAEAIAPAERELAIRLKGARRSMSPMPSTTSDARSSNRDATRCAGARSSRRRARRSSRSGGRRASPTSTSFSPCRPSRFVRAALTSASGRRRRSSRRHFAIGPSRSAR